MHGTANKREQLDYAAIGMSLLCVLHCTALPLMAATLPWIAAIGIVDDWFHRAILLLVIPVSGWALSRVWQQQGEWWPLALGLLGMGLMVLATLDFFAWHNSGLEVGLTLAGAAILSSAHLINLRNFFGFGSVRSSMTTDSTV